jgi:hypothetical protein
MLMFHFLHLNASLFIRKSYEKYMDDNRTTREIMLTFMEPNIKILFEERFF